MKERAERILRIAEENYRVTKSRRDEIEKALEMLENNGISDELLKPIRLELEDYREAVMDALILKVIIRSGMRQHHWLED